MAGLRGWPVVVAALILSGPTARATDSSSYPPPLPPPRYERTTVVSNGVSWYLRGDLASRTGFIRGAQSPLGFADPTDNHIGSTVVGGAGFGIKSDWLRTDVTIDYAEPAKYRGTMAVPDDSTAKIQSTTALLNGYLDLGTWYRLTPYIGAGAGVGYTQVSEFASPAAPVGTPDKKQTKFAWAAMAGLALTISQNIALDAGYRYINIGDVTTGDAGAGTTTFKGVGGHEVRVGFRWSYDDFPRGH